MANRRLTFEVGANTRAFSSGMSKVKGVARNTASSIAGMFGVGLGVTGLVYGANKIINSLDDIGKTTKRIGGISTDFVQKLSFSAERTGTSMGTVEKGVRRMQRVISEAGDGLATYTRSLSKLGLTYEDLKDKSPEEQFKILISRLNGISNASEKSALAQQIFGRAGAELIPLMKEYNELASEAESKGLIIDKDNIKAAEELKDAITNLTTSITTLVANSGFVQWLNEVAQALSDINKAKKLEKAGEVQTKKVLVGYDYVPMSGTGGMLKIPKYEEQISAKAPTKEELSKFREKRDSRVTQTNTIIDEELAKVKAAELEEQKKSQAILADRIAKEQYSLSLLESQNKLSEQDFELFKINAEYNQKIADAKDAELQSILESQRQAELSAVNAKRQNETAKIQNEIKSTENEKLKVAQEELMFLKAKKTLSEKQYRQFEIMYNTQKELQGVQSEELQNTLKQLGMEKLSDIGGGSGGGVPIRGLLSSPAMNVNETKQLDVQKQQVGLVKEIKDLLSTIEKKENSTGSLVYG